MSVKLVSMFKVAHAVPVRDEVAIPMIKDAGRPHGVGEEGYRGLSAVG